MLTIKEILAEVDKLVPNPFAEKDKVVWLNEINKEFFEFVKIPKVHQFVTIAGKNNYTVPAEMKSQNVERVQVNHSLYESMQYEVVEPGHNFWILEDSVKELLLNPKPSISHMVGIVKYSKSAVQTFLPSNLTVTPEAPEEYHNTYVLGLCERVAKGMNDVTLANNYGSDYRSSISIAQQNYGNRMAEG